MALHMSSIHFHSFSVGPTSLGGLLRHAAVSGANLTPLRVDFSGMLGHCQNEQKASTNLYDFLSLTYHVAAGIALATRTGTELVVDGRTSISLQSVTVLVPPVASVTDIIIRKEHSCDFLEATPSMVFGRASKRRLAM